MKTFTFLFFTLLLITSCNNSQQNEATVQDSVTIHPGQEEGALQNVSGCYLRVLKRDTLAVHLEDRGDSITGKLSFDNYEKDASSGTVTGVKDKDILKLIYNFRSEGMYSVMEVYFKISGNGLIHGIGEVATKTDTTYYANPQTITYPAENELKKISCEQLDSKFK